MKREHDILKPFLDFMSSLSAQERLWLLEKFNKYFCDQCGEDYSESCGHEHN